MRALCRKPLHTPQPLIRVPLEIALDLDLYYFKTEDQIFCAEGNAERENKATEAAQSRNHSMYHMARVLERLHDCPYAVLPLTFRHDNSRNRRGFVFHKLQGFAMGFTTDRDFNTILVAAIEKALAAIHERRVVHMDFYLSNVMWKGDKSSIDVRVVDWDVVRFEGELLPNRMLTRLTRSPRYALYQNNRAIREYDTFFVDVMKHSLQNEAWQDLVQSEKVDLDLAFRNACFAFAKHLGLSTIQHDADVEEQFAEEEEEEEEESLLDDDMRGLRLRE
jgi:hypothetical protein